MANLKSSGTELDLLAKFAKFMDGSKGRDKFSKIVQYGSRAIKYQLLEADPKSDWGQRFDGLCSTTATGRKLWRMFKSVKELETTRKLFLEAINPSSNPDPIALYLNVVIRAAYCVYWGFDNVGYLVRAKFLKYDKKTVGLYGAYGWTIAVTASVVLALYELNKLEPKLRKAQRAYAEAKDKQRPADAADAKKQLIAILAKRVKLIQDAVRNACDVVVASSAAEIPQNTIGLNLSDLVIGVLGVVSASINASQIWDETK